MARNTHTEYGGGPGGPARRADGSSAFLTNKERERVLRQMGMRGDFDATAPDVVGPGGATNVVSSDPDLYAEDARRTAYNKATRAELDAKTNGYDKEVNFD